MDDDALDAIDPEHTPTAGEWELLTGFVDYYRIVIARKASDLDASQLAQTLGPSDLTLGGLVKHLTSVEDSWLGVRLLGNERAEPFASAPADDPDWDLHSAVDDEPDELLAAYAAACARSRANVESVRDTGGLDTVMAVANRRGVRFSLRWVLIHLVEEYARHAGHADLIRESIDGRTDD